MHFQDRKTEKKHDQERILPGWQVFYVNIFLLVDLGQALQREVTEKWAKDGFFNSLVLASRNQVDLYTHQQQNQKGAVVVTEYSVAKSEYNKTVKASRQVTGQLH